MRKGSIFSKNQLAKSIIFWTFLDRFPPNNGQKPLKIFARFARRILGSPKIFGALRARGSIFNKISKFRALRARGSIFNKISFFFARFAREVLLFPKSSRKSDPYGPGLGRIFRERYGSEIMCVSVSQLVSNHETTSRRSKKHPDTGLPGGSKYFSFF